MFPQHWSGEHQAEVCVKLKDRGLVWAGSVLSSYLPDSKGFLRLFVPQQGAAGATAFVLYPEIISGHKLHPIAIRNTGRQ